MSKLGIKRATTSVPLVTNLELLAEYDKASDVLEKLQKNARPDKMVGDTELRKAAQDVRALEDQMQDSTVLVKLRALKRTRWAELEEKHPAREDNDLDKRYGLNVDTFFDEAIPECIVEATWKTSGKKVDLDPSTDWAELADDMSDGQYAQFITAALALNRGAAAVPFSRVASVVIQGSEKK